jgi:hypothetical protein
MRRVNVVGRYRVYKGSHGPRPWRVVSARTNLEISRHPTHDDAIAAVTRYHEADLRRDKARELLDQLKQRLEACRP